MEFFDVNLSYIDLEENREEYVSVPEQGSGTLIPEGIGKPGHVHAVSGGASGRVGVFKFETQMISGNGKFKATGLGSDSAAKEKLIQLINILVLMLLQLVHPYPLLVMTLYSIPKI